MSKHTPGPWTIERRADDGHRSGAQLGIIRGPKKSQWIADVGLLHENDDRGGSLANAHLIAAAPELLEACIAALDEYEANDCDPEWCPAMNALRTAIAKATGKEARQ